MNNNNNNNELATLFRKTAARALDQARRNGKSRLLEIEFPPLLFKGKSQFDDFDNVQELDLNRDWCIEWLPLLSSSSSSSSKSNNNAQVWLILPDLKECELAKEEWKGGRYRDAAQFTTIEAVTRHYTTTSAATAKSNSKSNDEAKDNVATAENYKKPWGATLANVMSNLVSGGGDLLGDSSALDALEGSPDIHLIWYVRNPSLAVVVVVVVCMRVDSIRWIVMRNGC